MRRSSKFLSTPSVRRATAYSFICGFSTGISIHALREEGDLQGSGLCSQAGQISIHALREEGDNRIMSMLESPRLFLSTPSARRATSAYQASAGSSTISIHALREEGDTIRTQNWDVDNIISIHALREEGDTPCPLGRGSIAISIYALREEGDENSRFCKAWPTNFYLRPP